MDCVTVQYLRRRSLLRWDLQVCLNLVINIDILHSQLVISSDSKQLTEEQRDKLFADINGASDFMGWNVEIISPSFISNSMLARLQFEND